MWIGAAVVAAITSTNDARAMRYLGIHYDIGTTTIDRGTTRPDLDRPTIEREIADIATGLHANAVRITGVDVDRIRVAAEVAGRHGLGIWLSPMLPDADAATTMRAIETSATIAQRLRDAGNEVVLVVGCELSAFMRGVLPGEHQGDRLALLRDIDRLMAQVTAEGLDPQDTFDQFLREATDVARERFDGPLSYAAGPWESVDWSRFDIVGVDAYRDATNRTTYVDALRTRIEHERRVVVTEFGCATYRGAADRGGMAWDVVERGSDGRGRRRVAGGGTPGAGGPHLVDGIVRDESSQAAELIDQLDAIQVAGADGAFVYTYIAPSYPASHDPMRDLDAASFALVRSWPDGRTEPKAAYRAIADRFEALRTVLAIK